MTSGGHGGRALYLGATSLDLGEVGAEVIPRGTNRLGAVYDGYYQQGAASAGG